MTGFLKAAPQTAAASATLYVFRYRTSTLTYLVKDMYKEPIIKHPEKASRPVACPPDSMSEPVTAEGGGSCGLPELLHVATDTSNMREIRLAVGTDYMRQPMPSASSRCPEHIDRFFLTKLSFVLRCSNDLGKVCDREWHLTTKGQPSESQSAGWQQRFRCAQRFAIAMTADSQQKPFPLQL